MSYLLEENRSTPLAFETKDTYLGNGDVFVGRSLAIRFATRDEAEVKRLKLPNPDEWMIVEA
jgi:hypothetical protein